MNKIGPDPDTSVKPEGEGQGVGVAYKRAHYFKMVSSAFDRDLSPLCLGRILIKEGHPNVVSRDIREFQPHRTFQHPLLLLGWLAYALVVYSSDSSGIFVRA